MQIRTIRTHKITPADTDLLALIDQYLPALAEQSVLAITSKIVSLCEGRVVKVGSVDKQQLIEAEADAFLPPSTNRYHVTLTIKGNIMIPNAGIDESNSDNHYVLWPADPQATANLVRNHLCRRFGLRQVGVLITDSKTTPLRWGVTGVAVAHSGFQALNDYVGRNDLFGRPLRMTQVNVADGLAAAAVLMMGEGDEQTPLAVINKAPCIHFQAEDPSAAELAGQAIALEDDLYAALLQGVEWQPGGRKRAE